MGFHASSCDQSAMMCDLVVSWTHAFHECPWMSTIVSVTQNPSYARLSSVSGLKIINFALKEILYILVVFTLDEDVQGYRNFLVCPTEQEFAARTLKSQRCPQNNAHKTEMTLTRNGWLESKRTSVQMGQVERSRQVCCLNSERCMHVLQCMQWQASIPSPWPLRHRLQKGQWYIPRPGWSSHSRHMLQ